MTSIRRKKKVNCKECGKYFFPFYTSKGLYCSIKCSTRKGKKHWNWKGDNITYGEIHSWNNKYCPKSGRCELCKLTDKRTEWALLKGSKHSRGIENYIELCRKCHIKYDRTDEWVKKSSEALKKTYSHQNPIKDKFCEYCYKKFTPAKKTRKFCSNSCSAKSKKPQKRERDNKGRFLSHQPLA